MAPYWIKNDLFIRYGAIRQEKPDYSNVPFRMTMGVSMAPYWMKSDLFIQYGAIDDPIIIRQGTPDYSSFDKEHRLFRCSLLNVNGIVYDSILAPFIQYLAIDNPIIIQQGTPHDLFIQYGAIDNPIIIRQGTPDY